MATTSSAPLLSADLSEAYDDAMDSLRLYAGRHPSWGCIVRSIESYVSHLEAGQLRHEGGL